MKKFSIFALAAVAMFVGCTKDVDTDIKVNDDIVRGELVEMSVVMEDTRVERDDATSKLSWSKGDQVAVVLENESKYTLDTKVYTINITNDGAKLEIPENTVYAIYPATIAKSVSKSIVTLDLPEAYTVATPEDIFNHNPMRGVIKGNKVIFNNLMGYVKVPLTGNDKLKTLTVKSEIFNGFKPFSKTATIDASDTNSGLVMATDNNARAYVKVKFSTPIDLSASPAVYVPVPANTYGNMALVVETDKGATSIYANNSHKITRSKIKPVSSSAINVTEHTPAAPKSLCGESGDSKMDYANTYIVPPTAGEYSFKAILADGTSLEGGVTAEIVWAEEAGMFYDFHYNPTEKTISFKSNGTEGNALVTLSQNNPPIDGNTIVWSWLLWCTDQPEVISIKGDNNNIYKVMDRVLGATWVPNALLTDQKAEKGWTSSYMMNGTIASQDATDGCGLYYQYQNMIPYPRMKNIDATVDEDTANRSNTRIAVQYGLHKYAQYWTPSTSCGTISKDKNGQYRTAASNNLSYMYFADNVDKNNDDNAINSNIVWCFTPLKGCSTGTWTAEDGDAYRLWGGTYSAGVNKSYKTNHDPCPAGYMIDNYSGYYHYVLKQNVSKFGYVRNPNESTKHTEGFRYYGMWLNGCTNSKGATVDLYFPCASNRSQTICETVGRDQYANMGYIYTYGTNDQGTTVYNWTFKKDGVYEEHICYQGACGQFGAKTAPNNGRDTKKVNAQAYNVRCRKFGN